MLATSYEFSLRGRLTRIVIELLTDTVVSSVASQLQSAASRTMHAGEEIGRDQRAIPTFVLGSDAVR